MNLFSIFKDHIRTALDQMVAAGQLPAGLDLDRIAVEPPRDPSHGDIATNAAMVLSKPAGQKPRDLAEALAERLRTLEAVDSAEVAGPGFLNLRVSGVVWQGALRAALNAGLAYGDSAMGAGQAVNVEYVSANPTGPMHVGHGRGAVVGDALAGLLTKAGFAVTKEYYINDAGAQVGELAKALHKRYLVACGALSQEAFDKALEDKEIQYGGDYLVAPAEALKARDGTRWVEAPEAEWFPALRDFGIAAMMDLIREDLAAVGVHHAVFTSERQLVETGKVAEAKDWLEQRGLIYVGVLEPPKGKLPDDWEARPQTLFRATDFGDDVDRALMKSDGSWTYFASDIAYHRNKFERGFTQMIDVWGADHGGYVKRMQAAVKAVSEGTADLDVKLCQLVKLLDNGEPVKMSKRAGTFITLREVVERVGKDSLRFMMLTRKNDAALDFDYAKVLEKSRDNPVFYVQYAHARCHSVLGHAEELFSPEAVTTEALASKADLSLLADEAEIAVLRRIAEWPRQVEAAAEAHEPHRIAYYLHDLAGDFHTLWTRGRENAELRFLEPEKEALSLARLALVRGVATVIASGLFVFGIDPIEEMH